MKIASVADIHGFLPDVPKCDLLLIAGDVCPVENHNVSFQEEWLDTEFRGWLEQVPAQEIVGVAGNHDFVFDPILTPFGNAMGFYDRAEWTPPDDLAWTYLEDSSCVVEGLDIYGTPWTPYFGGWAFNLRRGEAGQHGYEVFDAVPASTDILVTHGPPYGVLDRTTIGDHPGCSAQLEAVRRVQPRLNCFGHIHEGGGGRMLRGDTLCMNVSYVNHAYEPTNEIKVVELDA